MSRQIKKTEKMVEIKTETIRCDLCNIKAKSATNWNELSRYDINQTTIHQKEGSIYPENGSGEEYIVDLCPDCFKEKLIPWLNSQGANLKQTDWDC